MATDGAATPAAPGSNSAERRPIRWWGIPLVALILMGAITQLPQRLLSTDTFEQHQFMFFIMAMYAPMIAALVFVVWWLFLSGLSWSTRIIGLGIVSLAGLIAWLISHPSMGMVLVLWGLPLSLLGWMVAILLTRNARPRTQLAVLAIGLAAGWAYTSLLRLDGVSGAFVTDMRWRWVPTAEQKFLAERTGENAPDVSEVAAPLEIQPGDWPGFRGPHRDGIAERVTFGADWEAAPPKLKWKHRVGPGWSSFAVVGPRLYTQEQRGDLEAIVCYDAETGNELWSYTEQDRFEEPIGGPGPRATPTIDGGKLYALGAGGLLVCVDAATGAHHWTADIKTDSGAAKPMWGFSSSPLVVDGKVLIHTGAGNGKSVLAYQADDGKLAWAGGDGGHSYCSLHLHDIDGVPQALVCTETGVESFDPATGSVLWRHDWAPVSGVVRVVQPALYQGDRVLIGTGMGVGTRSVKVSHEGAKWQVDEDWTSGDFKPYFNDFVILGDHAYGFDGTVFCCIDLQTGKRAWKGGRYGAGQVLALPAMNRLLVITEQGELALLEVNPERFVELVKAPGIEGKTWNHPVVAHGKLFVRNAEEMACFELPAAEAPAGEATPAP